MRILKGVSSEQVWNKTIEYYSTYTHTYLKPIVQKLATIAKGAPSSKQNAIHIKYKMPKFEHISVHSELRGPRLDAIIAEEK